MQLPRSDSMPHARALRIGLAAIAVAAALLLWGGVLLDLLRIAFGGAAIAFLLTPLSRLLERRLPRPAAAICALVIALIALLGLVALLLPMIVRQLSGLLSLLPEAFDRLRALVAELISRVQARVPGLSLPSLNLSGMEVALTNLLRAAPGYVTGLGDGLYRLFLMVVLAYFLISDRARALLRMELLCPAAHRALLVRTGKALVRELRLYLRGQATIALAVGALAAALMLFLGVPGAPLLGALVGVFNVIPYLGPVIGGIPAVLTALGVGWQMALGALAILFLVQQVDGLVISPRVMGALTGFSPAVVLLALFAGARVGGVFGMLLALPALLSIRTLYRVFVQRHENN